MEPLKIFDDFHLEKLSESWVKATWEKEFLIIDPIPDDYILFVESNVKDIASLIRDTTKIIKCWIEDNTNDRESQPAELSWQTLSSLDVNSKALLALLGYLMKTGEDRRHDEEDREACLVATSLYLTLLTIPGSSVYEIFHENLFHKALDSLKFSDFISPPERKSRQDIEQLYEEEDEFYLPHAKRKILTEALNTIMYDIILFLKKFSLMDLPRSLEAVVTALIGVTKLGTDNMPLSSPRKQSPSLASLNHNAYAALTDTCHPRHGPIDITMRIIAKNILAFMTNNYYNDLGTKRLTNVRERTIHFLKTLIILHKSPAEDAVLILINLMMINCSKTAEDRKKEVMMIIKLIKICEGKAGEIIKDLVRFSHNNKVTSRIFAQEIINKYLMDGVEDFERTEVENHRKILLGTVLCHCYDTSSLVRAKALSTIYEYTKTPDNLYVNELFTKEEQNGIPLIEDLEKALENLSIDTDILPDAQSIICMLKDRVEDERASVRVFAIQILRNFVAVNQDFLGTTIAIMSKRCRDATMTVRSHAIQLLTSLFESYPHHSRLCATWVKSVIPQIFDVETKVQAEALNALESLIIKRIARHKENDDLPWKIIRELTKNKMKKHLARACAAWSESAILTKSLVNNIKSQINTENNSEAWVLLSAISRTKILPNMQEYFSNYTQLLESDQFVDPILEVLTVCWSKFDENFLEKLYNDFLTLLADFKVNSRLINISLDIVNHIYAFLLARGKPQKRTFKGEMKLLIKLSEAIIDKTAVVEVDEKIFDRAIRTLGNAPMLCTAEISLRILRVLQGYLLDSDMLPKWLKSPRKMQASTIITLGQCSIRDESIAHEMTPIFAKLLSSKSLDDPDEDAAVRVNAAKALADICIIFTSLVEPHLPDICVSMKDSNPAVRQTIVVIFIQLLVEDYIKVKGNFLFHILTMLTDEDPTIRDMTIFLIKERLLRKNKEIIGLQFFEAILHYNDFELPNQVCKREMREFEKESLLLAGKTNEKKRRIIYDFMLEHLEPGLKLKLISTIVTKIFNGIISGNIKIKNEAAIWVLKDSLYVVSHEQLQVGSRARQDEEDEEGGGSFNSSSNILLEKLKNNVLILLLSCMVDLRKKLKKTEFQETVSKSFLRIIGELGKEKLQALLSEYPKIDAEFERNTRLYGRGNEFEQETEDSEEPIGESLSTNTANHQLLLDNRTPRVVLRRLSI